MTPGTYLRKRREAAGLTLTDVSLALVALPLSRGASPRQVAQLAARLGEAEGDRDNLVVLQVALLRQVFPLDSQVYQDLLVRHWAGPASFLRAPQICRECGCSWHAPCRTDHGSCAWSADPGLCTACETVAQRVGEAA